jgi:hypothetical protein
MLGITYCLDSQLTDGGKVVSLTLRPRFNPQELLLLPPVLFLFEAMFAVCRKA